MWSLIILQCYIGLPVNSYPMSAKTNSSWGSKGYSTLKLVLKSAVKVSGGMTDRGQHATVSTNLILSLYLNTSSSYTQVTEKKEKMFSWKYSNISHAQLARLQWNLTNSNTLERKGNSLYFFFILHVRQASAYVLANNWLIIPSSGCATFGYTMTLQYSWTLTGRGITN